MIALGTVRPGSTIQIPFHTFDSNDPSASVIVSAFVAGDIEVYKDGGTTQRASDNGYTLLDTDGINFDGHVGVHGISIDLADNSTANFYEAGSRYFVVIGPITIDGATINFVAATFDIGYPSAILNTTIATLASQTSFTLEDGSANDDAFNGSVLVVHALASAIQLAQGDVDDYTGSSKTITLKTDPGIYTMAVGDSVSIFQRTNFEKIADDVADEVYTGATHNVANSLARRIRDLQENGVYEGAQVWIDTVNGTAGTTDFESGTQMKP